MDLPKLYTPAHPQITNKLFQCTNENRQIALPNSNRIQFIEFKSIHMHNQCDMVTLYTCAELDLITIIGRWQFVCKFD